MFLSALLVLVLGTDLPSMPFLAAETFAPSQAVTVHSDLHHSEPDERHAAKNPHAHCLMCLLPVANLPKAEAVALAYDARSWAVSAYDSRHVPDVSSFPLGARGPPT